MYSLEGVPDIVGFKVDERRCRTLFIVEVSTKWCLIICNDHTLGLHGVTGNF